MKFFKAVISSILALTMLFFTACSDKNTGNGSQQGSDGEYIEDAAIHYAEGTLHKINVTESSRPFVTPAGSEYKVVMSDGNENTFASFAANFIIKHVKEATGFELPVEENPAWSDDAKYIVVGNDALFKAAGLTMPEDDIGFTGYYIRTAGDSVFIAAEGDDGYQMGAIAFLRETIGYDMLSGDLTVYEKKGETLPDMEIIERPDFDYRQYSQPVGKTAQYGMGYTDNSIFMSVNGSTWHNSFQYLPPEQYAAQYPEWYSKDGLTQSSATMGQNPGQLCYTAHGDSEKLKFMQETLYKKLKEVVDLNQNLRNITITHEDNYTLCDCDACKAEKEKYGGSEAAPIIEFLNTMAEWLERDFAAEGVDRTVYISFFAYRASEQSPTVRNTDGTYTPINGIRCHKNVGVVIAPITASYSHSFYEEQNESFAENIKSWAAVCDNIYLWLYQTNYSYYLYPFASWDTVAETYRFAKSNNAVYMYNEGQWNQGNVTHFSKLKEYLDARLENNVNLNSAELTDKFFKYYYGDGGVYMREFFDGLQAHMRYLETTYPATVKGGINDNMAQTAYWPKKLIDGWMQLIDKAYEAVAKTAASDPRYEIYLRHINLESIFPKYVLCSLYSGSYSAETLRETRSQFKSDCEELDIDYLSERVPISGLFDTWGV